MFTYSWFKLKIMFVIQKSFSVFLGNQNQLGPKAYSDLILFFYFIPHRPNSKCPSLPCSAHLHIHLLPLGILGSSANDCRLCPASPVVLPWAVESSIWRIIAPSPFPLIKRSSSHCLLSRNQPSHEGTHHHRFLVDRLPEPIKGAPSTTFTPLFHCRGRLHFSLLRSALTIRSRGHYRLT
jgi:hypothetical protein